MTQSWFLIEYDVPIVLFSHYELNRFVSIVQTDLKFYANFLCPKVIIGKFSHSIPFLIPRRNNLPISTCLFTDTTFPNSIIRNTKQTLYYAPEISQANLTRPPSFAQIPAFVLADPLICFEREIFNPSNPSRLASPDRPPRPLMMMAAYVLAAGKRSICHTYPYFRRVSPHLHIAQRHSRIHYIYYIVLLCMCVNIPLELFTGND